MSGGNVSSAAQFLSNNMDGNKFSLLTLGSPFVDDFFQCFFPIKIIAYSKDIFHQQFQGKPFGFNGWLVF